MRIELELQELGQQRQDATLSAATYSRFVANMRVLQAGGSAANELQNDRRAFLVIRTSASTVGF